MTILMSVTGLLVLAAFVCTLFSWTGRVVVQVPILLLVLVELLQLLPK